MTSEKESNVFPPAGFSVLSPEPGTESTARGQKTESEDLFSLKLYT